MYWQERADEGTDVIPDDVVDVVFGIACRALPVEHAYALWSAVGGVLPWLRDEPGAGIHPIHVADSGNGWMRPGRPDDLLHPSRRTKLVIRVPKARVADTERLSGHTLDVAGNALRVDAASVRRLSPLTTIFSRYVAIERALDENAFLAEALAQLNGLGVKPKKMLCGIEHSIATPDGPLRTRSLMLAELTPAEALTVQQRGLGPMGHLGCGLFIPHKDIKELAARE